MQYILMVLFALGIVALDQYTKYLTVASIAPPPGADAEVLANAFGLADKNLTALPRTAQGVPGVFSITHYHNTGAAWSSFEGMIWLFILIFAVLTFAIIWEFSKKRWGFTNFERWLIVAIYGGGLGNMIDRIRLGYVVDMVKLDFMDFPIFNAADCFITCACILLLVHLVFFNKKFWKDDKKK